MTRDIVTIMEIPFDRITLSDATTLLLEILAEKPPKSFFVATPNPEMLLAARKNANFKIILQNTALNIPDGTGIIWASKVLKKPLTFEIIKCLILNSISLCAWSIDHLVLVVTKDVSMLNLLEI